MVSQLSELAKTGAVTTCSFDFLSRSEVYNHEKPYYFSGALDSDQESKRTNLEYVTHDGIEVRDLRGREQFLSLETHGFELLQHESKTNLVEPSDDDIVKYLEEMSAVVKQHLDAEVVLAYNFRFRKAPPKSESTKANGSVGTFSNQDRPVLVPHTDQTSEGGPRRVRNHLSEDEAKRYLDGNWRVRILNCWRPLQNPADERPLAMCDYSSVDKSDLRSADRASREYVGEIYYSHYNPRQRWYWINGQRPEEVMLFVNYDSDPATSPPFMLHSSFLNTTASEQTKPRQSLETALIVISRKEKKN